MTNNTKQPVVSPVARKAMVREYGERNTENLIAMGKTCVAEVTQEDISAAKNMQCLPGVIQEGTICEVQLQEENSTGLDLTCDECVVTANTLEKRVEKHVEMTHKIYRQTLSAALCLGFVLIETKQKSNRTFKKRFSQKDTDISNGCFRFSYRNAVRYMKLAEFTARRAEERGASSELLAQVRDYIHTGITAELDCLDNLLDADSLRQALIECGAIPKPQPKGLPFPHPQEEPAGSSVMTPEEEEETTWASAARLLGGFQTFVKTEIVKLDPAKRLYLREQLEELLKELDEVGNI